MGKFGEQKITAISTPGHTDGCMSFICHELRSVFTGDLIFVRKCGRTDFQEGCSYTMWDNVHNKIFTLPEDYFIYPAHDYAGHLRSTVEEEKKYNLRLTKSKEDFKKIMDSLNLSYPAKIDVALPANMNCGYPTDKDDK